VLLNSVSRAAARGSKLMTAAYLLSCQGSLWTFLEAGGMILLLMKGIENVSNLQDQLQTDVAAVFLQVTCSAYITCTGA
jgi:hypothetical protein